MILIFLIRITESPVFTSGHCVATVWPLCGHCVATVTLAQRATTKVDIVWQHAWIAHWGPKAVPECFAC